MSKTKTWETIKNSVGGGGVMVKYFVPNFLNNLWCLGKKKKNFMYVFCITNIRHTQRKLGNCCEVEKAVIFPTSS